MAKVDGAYPSLLQGMSQQPERDRANGQCILQKNASVRPINGLTDRPAFEHIVDLPTININAVHHNYDQGINNQYRMSIHDGVIEVTDWAGVNYPVVVNAGAEPYITEANNTNIQMSTIGDYTMVTNTSVVVTEEPADTNERNVSATYQVRKCNFGRKVGISFSAEDETILCTVEYVSPDGTTTSSGGSSNTTKANNKFNDPSYVAWRIWWAVTQNSTGVPTSIPSEWADVTHTLAKINITGDTAPYTASRNGAVIIVSPLNINTYIDEAAVLGVGVADDIAVALNQVRAVEDLPSTSYEGHVIRIAPDDNSDSGYYLKYEINYIADEQPVPIVDWQITAATSTWGSEDHMGYADEWQPAHPTFGSLDYTRTGNGTITAFTERTHAGVGGAYYAFSIRDPGVVATHIECRDTLTGVLVFSYPLYDSSDLTGYNSYEYSLFYPDGTPAPDFSMVSGRQYDIQLNLATNPGNQVTSGQWVETRALRISPSLTPTTMPHALINLKNGTFGFTQLDGTDFEGITLEEWSPRSAGDDISNPHPRFVGSTIKGIGHYQDRMYLYSKEFMQFSKIALYWDMYVTSTASFADDDGFEVTSVTGKIQDIQHVVPNNRDLVVFTRDTQFVVDGSVVITPNNAVLNLTTSFSIDTDVVPVAAGNTISFAYNQGQFTGVREFYTDSITDSNNARATTDHVQELIVGEAKQLLASTHEDTLIVLPETDNYQRLYVYNYKFNEQNQRVQSAWGYWELSLDYSFEYIWFDDTILYAVIRDRGTGDSFLEKCDLSDPTITGMPYNPRLDHRTVEAVDANESIVWDLDVDYNDYTFIQGANALYPGLKAIPDRVDEEGFLYFKNLVHNNGVGEVYIGIDYDFQYSPTRPFVLDDNGVPVTSDALNLLDNTIHLEDTTHLDATLISPYYQEFTYEFRGYGTSVLGSNVGELPMYTGPWPIMLGLDASVVQLILSKRNPTPVRIVDIEWSGTYNKRGNRL